MTNLQILEKHLFFALLLCTQLTTNAQQVTDTLNTDYTAYKGKLLVINEFHNVAANDVVYEHIIRKISATMGDTDTLNLILETPYSKAYLLNRYLAGDTQAIPGMKPFVTAIKGLGHPVRIIGIDFEYDMGKRGDVYLLFLNDVVKELNKNNIPTTRLTEYITSLWADGKWNNPTLRDAVADYYLAAQKNLSPQSPLYRTLSELIFVLQATHHISSVHLRDQKTFERVIEAQERGLVGLKNNYNVLIHGSMHTDPTKKNSLFGHFQNRSSSPFFGNCFSLAQVYVECSNKGDYFIQNESEGNITLLSNDKANDELIKLIKADYSTTLQKHTITNFETIKNLPNDLQQLPVVSWFVQWYTR